MANQELGISNPGRCSQLISTEKAVKKDPSFPEKATWGITIKSVKTGEVYEFAPGTVDVEWISRFGSYRSAVVTDNEGNPLYDKPRSDEAPNVNIIAWGKDQNTHEVKVAIISQARPHADNEFETDNIDPMVFEQIPMGFKDKIIGKDQIEKFESVNEAASRETTEETGAFAVLDITYPEYPKHYPNPSFIGTTSDLVFVEVDLNQIDKMKMDRTEPIFKSDYIPVSKLLKDIKNGKTDHGYARMCTANSAILIFLAGLEEFQNAQRNHKFVSRRVETARAARGNDKTKYKELIQKRKEIDLQLQSLASGKK